MKKIIVSLLLVLSIFTLNACGSGVKDENPLDVQFFNVKDIKLSLAVEPIAIDVISGIQVWEGSSNKTNELLYTIKDSDDTQVNSIYQNVEDRYHVTYVYLDSEQNRHEATRYIQVGDMLSKYDYDKVKQTYSILFEDDFNGTSLDETKWKHDIGNGNWGWGNNEKQYYTKDSKNIGVRDGNLYITALNDGFGGCDYTSGKITSQYMVDFKYGYVEAKMILPEGRGSWAAFWMMPTHSKYGIWPASGEIDIMEHVGYDPGVVHANTHTSKYHGGGHNGLGGKTYPTDVFNQYHTYGVEWLPDRLNFFIDGTLYYTYEPAKWSGTGGITQEVWPFDEEFFLIFNLAIGGQWGGAQGIDEKIFPTTMLVDYVKVYQSSEIKNMYN